MVISDGLQEGIVRLAEQAAAERGLSGEAKEQAMVTIIEEIAVAVGDALAQKIMEQRLAAEAACAEPICPKCQGRGLRKGEQKRKILTRRGEVEFVDVECYCRRCRRSFFPSLPSVGTGCEL
jgi:hypothetical protein